MEKKEIQNFLELLASLYFFSQIKIPAVLEAPPLLKYKTAEFLLKYSSLPIHKLSEFALIPQSYFFMASPLKKRKPLLNEFIISVLSQGHNFFSFCHSLFSEIKAKYPQLLPLIQKIYKTHFLDNANISTKKREGRKRFPP